MLLYKLAAAGFLSCFRQHHIALLPDETIKYADNFFLHFKVKIYQLQAPDNKTQLLIFMLAITPVQPWQERNPDLHRCVCMCFYACVHI